MFAFMLTRTAIALGLAAALIPLSILLGLSAKNSVFVSLIVGLLFLFLSSAMSGFLKR
jgi:hypothetical protein